MNRTLRILKLIGDEPRQTPTTLSKKFEMSSSYMRNTLVTLYELGLVKREARGLYVLTELGLRVLDHSYKISLKAEE